MSFSKQFNGVVEEFISIVSHKYNIKERELLSIWCGKDVKTEVEKDIQEESREKINYDSMELSKMTGAELKSICTKHGYKKTGKKLDLIQNILQKNVSKANMRKNQTKKLKKHVNSKIVDSFEKSKVNVKICKNQYGNYEHSSGLIFKYNSDDKAVVVGRQSKDGNIDTLTEEDILFCKSENFDYELPEKLFEPDKNIVDDILDTVESDIEEELLIEYSDEEDEDESENEE